jgi:hypothetical protein
MLRWYSQLRSSRKRDLPLCHMLSLLFSCSTCGCVSCLLAALCVFCVHGFQLFTHVNGVSCTVVAALLVFVFMAFRFSHM